MKRKTKSILSFCTCVCVDFFNCPLNWIVEIEEIQTIDVNNRINTIHTHTRAFALQTERIVR